MHLRIRDEDFDNDTFWSVSKIRDISKLTGDEFAMRYPHFIGGSYAPKPSQPAHEVSKDSKDAQDFARSRKPHNTGKTRLRVLGTLTTRGLIFYISHGKFRTSPGKVQASQPNLRSRLAFPSVDETSY